MRTLFFSYLILLALTTINHSLIAMEEDCSVCIAPLKPPTATKVFPCSHSLHRNCYQALKIPLLWNNKSVQCPLCRGTIKLPPLPSTGSCFVTDKQEIIDYRTKVVHKDLSKTKRLQWLKQCYEDLNKDRLIVGDAYRYLEQQYDSQDESQDKKKLGRIEHCIRELHEHPLASRGKFSQKFINQLLAKERRVLGPFYTSDQVRLALASFILDKAKESSFQPSVELHSAMAQELLEYQTQAVIQRIKRLGEYQNYFLRRYPDLKLKQILTKRDRQAETLEEFHRYVPFTIPLAICSVYFNDHIITEGKDAILYTALLTSAVLLGTSVLRCFPTLIAWLNIHRQRKILVNASPDIREAFKYSSGVELGTHVLSALAGGALLAASRYCGPAQPIAQTLIASPSLLVPWLTQFPLRHARKNYRQFWTSK